MGRTPNEPRRRWPVKLFGGKLRPPVEDALLLVAACHDVRSFAGAIEGAFRCYRDGALPLEAVEVTAALTAIARFKDYGCHPGSLRECVVEARPIVFQNQHLGLPWAAMCSAFDAIGAGSFAALERLGEIVDQAGDRPALIWLDEVACRVARETARAERRAATLDRLLASGALHRRAVPPVPQRADRGRRARGAD